MSDPSPVFDPNTPEQPSPASKRSNRLGQLFLLVLVPAILLGGLILGFRALSGDGGTTTAALPAEVPTALPSPGPTVVPTLLSVNTPILTLAPTLAPTDTPAPLPTPTVTATPVPPEQVVAVVNGQVVSAESVRIAQAVDAAMADLLDRPAEAQVTLLERVINLELTRQAADLVGFVLDPAQVALTQAQLLTGNGRTVEDLTRSLGQGDVTLAQFQGYLGQLLRSEQFLRQQAQAQGSSSAEVLQRTQDQAQISLGLAAEAVAALPTPVPPLAQPTAEPVAEAPAPTPDLAERVRGISPGQLLPDFLLPVVAPEGGAATTNLTANELIGTPSVLSFYTTWCPYCERQTPILVDSYASAAAQGVRFVGIDVKEPNEVAMPYIQGHGIPYPVLLDESGSVAAAYGVPGYPTTYFLDRQGQIVDRHIGALTAEQLTAFLVRITE